MYPAISTIRDYDRAGCPAFWSARSGSIKGHRGYDHRELADGDEAMSHTHGG
jgi:hypothetical protein